MNFDVGGRCDDDVVRLVGCEAKTLRCRHRGCPQLGHALLLLPSIYTSRQPPGAYVHPNIIMRIYSRYYNTRALYACYCYYGRAASGKRSPRNHLHRPLITVSNPDAIHLYIYVCTTCFILYTCAHNILLNHCIHLAIRLCAYTEHLLHARECERTSVPFIILCTIIYIHVLHSRNVHSLLHHSRSSTFVVPRSTGLFNEWFLRGSNSSLSTVVFARHRDHLLRGMHHVFYLNSIQYKLQSISI